MRTCWNRYAVTFAEKIATSSQIFKNETESGQTSSGNNANMGKSSKSKRARENGAASKSGAKKARVDVKFEGEAPKPTAVNGGSSSSTSKDVQGSYSAGITGPSVKGKEKAKVEDEVSSTPIAASLDTFLVIAGSYEKLLYGLEGSFAPSSSSSTGHGEIKPKLEPIFIFPAHLACVKAIAASPGGKWLATGSEDEFVKVWDLRRRKEVGSLSQHVGESAWTWRH